MSSTDQPGGLPPHSDSAQRSSGHPDPADVEIVDLEAAQLSDRLDAAMEIYLAAMGYPRATAEQRAAVWTRHMQQSGFRAAAGMDSAGRMVSICYGYHSAGDTWWHQEVLRGLRRRYPHGPPADVSRWLEDAFELTELHVLPGAQGAGLGERTLRRVLSQVSEPAVLLSALEPAAGDRSPARALYSRLGFEAILQHYRFLGDQRAFAVLGRSLPLPRELPLPHG